MDASTEVQVIVGILTSLPGLAALGMHFKAINNGKTANNGSTLVDGHGVNSAGGPVTVIEPSTEQERCSIGVQLSLQRLELVLDQLRDNGKDIKSVLQAVHERLSIIEDRAMMDRVRNEGAQK